MFFIKYLKTKNILSVACSSWTTLWYVRKPEAARMWILASRHLKFKLHVVKTNFVLPKYLKVLIV